jgi:hypothetical protein
MAALQASSLPVAPGAPDRYWWPGTEHAPPLDLLPVHGHCNGALALMAVVYPLHLPLLLGSFYDSHPRPSSTSTRGDRRAILGASYQLLPVPGPSFGTARPLEPVRPVYAFVAGLSQGWLVPPPPAVRCCLLPWPCTCGSSLHISARRQRDVVAWHIARRRLVGRATLGLLLALSKFTGFLGATTLPVLAAHVS